jgi:signal transduction histidine kinase/ligand-binding sensor domain-containing protein
VSRSKRTSALLAATVVALAAAGEAAALEPAAHLDGYSRRAWPRVARTSAVRVLLLSRDGHLWIGTEEGLVRFDGQSMVAFDSRRLPGLAEGNVERVFEASDGSVWVASRAAGLSRIRGSEVVSVGTAQGLPSQLVRAFAETADGSVWTATFDGVVRFARGSLHPEPLNAGLADRRVDSIAVDREGVIWAGTRSGLHRWEPALRRWRPEPGPRTTPVRIHGLLPEPDGTLLVGTFGDGVWERRGSRWRSFGTGDGLPSSQVSALLRDRGGRLWAATRDGGLSFRTGDRFQRLPLGLGTCDQNIEALAEDAEGGLWIATEFCGLHRLQNRAIQTITRRDGLPMDPILGLAGASDGTVWIGTRGGGMARIAPGQKTAQALACPPDVSCGGCWDIAPAAPGTFWAICGNNQLVRFDGQTLSRPPVPGGLDAVELVTVAADGAVWLARGNSVVRWRGAEVTQITAQEKLRGKRVLYEGRNGAMWIAAYDGIAVWRGGNTRIVRFAGDAQAEASTLYEDRDGGLWIGTKGLGIYHLRGDRAVVIGVAQGLPTSWIVQILEDDRGRLWLSTGKGIASVARGELEEVAAGRRTRVAPSLYDGADGVLMRQEAFGHPAGWKAPDGRLWFATAGGVAVLDPPAPTRAPRVVLEEIQVGGRRLPIAAGPVVARGPGDLLARFGALSFAEPETISFRYRLEGKDRDWIEAGSARSLTYPQLPAGNYRLNIQARAREGVWGATDGGAVAQLAFVLRPPFYRTPWFVLSAALGLALLLVLTHRVRLAQQRAGLQAVMAERARIARDIHDTLAQAFVATSVQLECLDQALENGNRDTMQRHLGTARRMVKESLDEARRSVWVLRPQALERGLPDALRTLVGGASGDTQVALEVTGAQRPLPPLVETNLLRLAQEAVANAYRHAQARRIDVRLCYQADSVRLSITDDGTGLASDGEAPVERGLAGMKERASEIGGTLFIESRAGGGTQIRAEVPR